MRPDGDEPKVPNIGNIRDPERRSQPGCSVRRMTADFSHAAKDPTDVTSKVAAAVKDESLSISASNEIFGDTAAGIPKKLTVEYRVGSEKQTKEVKLLNKMFMFGK